MGSRWKDGTAVRATRPCGLAAGLRRNTLPLARLGNIVFYQLGRRRLGTAHDQVAGRPEIAGRIFLFETRKLGKDLFRSVLTENAHQVSRRGSRRDIDDPLQISRPDGDVLQPPAKSDTNLRDPFPHAFREI